MSIGTMLYTWRKGRQIGSDRFGNRYFTEKNPPGGRRVKRWVMFGGAKDPSTVPPEWHAWLHYTVDEPLARNDRPWAVEHLANQTGTAGAYLPPGHDLRGGQRPRATGDYEAWRP